MKTKYLAILTIDTDNLPPNFQDIIKEEGEVVRKWKSEGILDQLYLRPSRNGAVLIFNDIEEHELHELMATLPLFRLKKSIEYVPLLKQF
jgi:muconolactone D-isomerase